MANVDQVIHNSDMGDVFTHTESRHMIGQVSYLEEQNRCDLKTSNPDPSIGQNEASAASIAQLRKGTSDGLIATPKRKVLNGSTQIETHNSLHFDEKSDLSENHQSPSAKRTVNNHLGNAIPQNENVGSPTNYTVELAVGNAVQKTPTKATNPPESHSPIPRGKISYRVGLSKRNRIAPLLKIIKK